MTPLYSYDKLHHSQLGREFYGRYSPVRMIRVRQNTAQDGIQGCPCRQYITNAIALMKPPSLSTKLPSGLTSIKRTPTNPPAHLPTSYTNERVMHSSPAPSQPPLTHASTLSPSCPLSSPPSVRTSTPHIDRRFAIRLIQAAREGSGL